MLLDNAVEKFLLSREADDRRARTIGSYRQRLSGFQQFIKAQGLCEIAEIEPDIVDAWVVSLRRRRCKYQNHPCKPQEPGKLSKSTIAGLIQSVKALFEWCVGRNHLTSSPARHLKCSRPKKSARNKVMDPADLLLIVAEAEQRAKAGRPRDLALVLFAADTGCRRGEIKSLRISNLNLDNLEALVRGKNMGEEDEREVEFGEVSAQALRDWLTVRPKVDHDYVFVSLSTTPKQYGGPLGVNGIYAVFKRLAKASGVKGLYNPHSIRHLVGQHFTDNTNLELARQKLGHSDISVTADFYAHQDRGRVKRATRRHSLLNHLDKE